MLQAHSNDQYLDEDDVQNEAALSELNILVKSLPKTSSPYNAQSLDPDVDTKKNIKLYKRYQFFLVGTIVVKFQMEKSQLRSVEQIFVSSLLKSRD